MSDDKRDATFHPGTGPIPDQPLPQRDPYATFARYGAPPEHQSHPHYAAGRPPWDSQVHQPTPGKKRSRWWVWAIVAVAGLALCAFGGLAVLGLGGKAVVNQVDKEAADRRADVVVTACSLGEFDTVTVKYTVHNHSDQTQSYLPQFNIEDAQGTVYGQAADVVNDLAPGKEYKGSAVSTVEKAPGKARITCKLTNA